MKLFLIVVVVILVVIIIYQRYVIFDLDFDNKCNEEELKDQRLHIDKLNEYILKTRNEKRQV